MDFQAILDEITATLQADLRAHGPRGEVAQYIPALARVSPGHIGMALRTCDGQEAVAGDGALPFSIQSISKVFTLTLAMQHLSEEQLWSRIGREPSGTAFNSLIQLELEHGTPRNPFINAGAIAVADRLVGLYGDAACAQLSAFLSDLSGEPIGYDEEVAASEAATGFRNQALANFMKSFGRVDHTVDAVLDLYFHQCSLSMSCLQLARAAAYLSRDGAHPVRPGAHIMTERQTRRINSLMLTCGTYDAAGEFAYRIGLPCKSGVGGGILAVVPDHLTLVVWSPALDETGNSVLGQKALELFTRRTGLSIF